MESPLSPKDRAHLYADGHGRFVNFQDEHLFRGKLEDGRRVGNTRFADFSITFPYRQN